MFRVARQGCPKERRKEENHIVNVLLNSIAASFK